MESHSRIALIHQLYQSTVAGSFPIPDGGDAFAIARGEAEEALDTARVHLLLAVRDGYAYYIAAASRELASLPGFATPLAAALPNHPAHVGDAAYRVSFGDYAAAVIAKGESLRLIVGFQHEVATSIRPEGEAELPVIDCDDKHAVRLESEAWIYRSLADKVSRNTALFSMAVLGAAMTIGLVSNGVTGYYGGGSGRSATKLAAEAEAVIRSTPLTQPLGVQLVRIIELSKATVETGGWIDSYMYTAESGEAFTVTLPGWVTSEAIKRLGAGISTHKQPKEVNLIWARKADKRGIFAPGPGPAQVLDEKAKGGTAQAAPRPAAKPQQETKDGSPS